MLGTKHGFTIVELITVVLIVGILAAVAIPKYMSVSHRARASEFPTVLTCIYMAEQTYRTEADSYTDDFTALSVEIPTSGWFSYSTDLSGSTAFTAIALASKNFGRVSSGTEASIDHNGVKKADGYLSTYVPNWE